MGPTGEMMLKYRAFLVCTLFVKIPNLPNLPGVRWDKLCGQVSTLQSSRAIKLDVDQNQQFQLLQQLQTPTREVLLFLVI